MGWKGKEAGKQFVSKERGKKLSFEIFHRDQKTGFSEV